MNLITLSIELIEVNKMFFIQCQKTEDIHKKPLNARYIFLKYTIHDSTIKQNDLIFFVNGTH